MKLSSKTIKELGIILHDEFNLCLSDKDIEKMANSLVGYFGLLLKIQIREEVQK